jgi:ribosomal protein S18 acetylase RimI-like enzyme
LLAELNRLLPQLSSSAVPLTETSLTDIVDHEACHLLVAVEGTRVLGSLTLVTFPIPTGFRAWIEDVVVDTEARGSGVGARLNEFALQVARDLGAKTVDLTSRPSREAANRLYLRLGFVARETNVYRFDLSS